MEIDGTKPIIQAMRVYSLLYNNQMNARALIGQSVMVYCASKLMEVSPVFFKEFVNHSPAPLIYEFFSCSSKIPRGLSAFKP